MRIVVSVGLLLSLMAGGVLAQTVSPAPIVNDEGSVVLITGTLTYTDLRFTDGASQPVIILEDQAGFVDRDRFYLMPMESQVMGQLTSDYYSSPVDYSLTLPQVPRGGYRDVDHNDQEDAGVQVFAVAYWENVFGDPFLEERDLYGGGWSTAYASTHVNFDDPEHFGEIDGGKLIVYAPDDKQGFPSGFGADGWLFTEDDPLVTLPQGYTIVDLDSAPFTFDRSREVVIDLIEPEGAALVDFSGYGLVEGFDAMIEKMREEYAFTEFKHVDWDAIVAELRPRFIMAEKNYDFEAYLLALRDLTWAIPDGHVGWGAEYYLADLIERETGGGWGMAVRELDDGRVIVTHLTPDAPAEEADIELRAEIIALDGVPVSETAEDVVPWNSPFSAEHVRRLEQFRYLMRSPVGTNVEVTFRNPGDAEDQTVTLISIDERESFESSSVREEFTGYELPLEFHLLPSGYAYVKIYSFSDDRMLSIQLWERLMNALRDQDSPGLIIDMRENLGGNGYLAYQMAAYLFDESLAAMMNGPFDAFGDGEEPDPRLAERFLAPEEKRFMGEVAVLVGPNCNSACEFFTYYLTTEDRATVVGQYPTAGLGGGVTYFLAPLGIYFQFTASPGLDAEGNIHIEGQGVVPGVRVPVTEETLFSTGDPVLEAAVQYLDALR